MIKVAVLMAVFNGRQWIDEQVTTILEQKNILVHLYISVDISTDGTYEWCKELEKRCCNVTVLDYGEYFGGAARNFFRLISDVEYSGFDYISFADQDDIWMQYKLFNATEILRHESFSAYSSNVIAFWPNGRKILVNKSQPQREWDYLFESAGPGCTFVLTIELVHLLVSVVAKNRKLIQDIYLHDWFIYALARSSGYKWFIDIEPSMLYRQHEGNQVGMNNGFNAVISRFKMILAGKGLEQSRQIAVLIGFEKNEFVVSWSRLRRLDIFKLAFKANSCRRRLRERFYFFCVCIILSIVLRKRK